MSKHIKEPLYKKIWFWIVAIVILCGVASSSGNTKINSRDTQNFVNKEIKKDEARQITYEKFFKIKMDSTYKEVKSILGEYKESKESEIDGIKVDIYTWYNDDNSSIDVIVKDNKVIGKSQAGLSMGKADVNLIKYTKIKKEMDYSKVKEILGDGELIYIFKTNGSTKLVYLWDNPSGGNMNITFENGKVIAKNRLGLN